MPHDPKLNNPKANSTQKPTKESKMKSIVSGIAALLVHHLQEQNSFTFSISFDVYHPDRGVHYPQLEVNTE